MTPDQLRSFGKYESCRIGLAHRVEKRRVCFRRGAIIVVKQFHFNQLRYIRRDSRDETQTHHSGFLSKATKRKSGILHIPPGVLSCAPDDYRADVNYDHMLANEPADATQRIKKIYSLEHDTGDTRVISASERVITIISLIYQPIQPSSFKSHYRALALNCEPPPWQ